MWNKVELVKYCFDNGDLTATQIKNYVAVGSLTTDEFKEITGKDYAVAQVSPASHRRTWIQGDVDIKNFRFY